MDRYRAIPIVALSGVLGFAAPASAGGSELVGTWEREALALSFNADGTGTMGEQSFRYMIEEDRLVMTFAEGTLVYDYKVDGKSLTVSGGDLAEPATFTKKGGDAPKKIGLGGAVKTPAQGATPGQGAAPGAPPAARPATLVGKWTGPDGSSVEFTRDTFVIGPNRVPFTLTGETITLTGPDGAKVEWPYKLSGDTLEVWVGGEKQVWKRVGGAQAPVAPAPGAAPGATGATPEGPREAVPASALVGGWDGDKGTAIFRADGTSVYNGDKSTWSVEGSTIKFVQGDKWISIPFQLKGDKLILGSGPFVTLTRAGIAGVWVGEESSIDPQIVLTFTQYVTLYKDGTVGYSKSEGYASRTQVTEHTERFSSGGTTGATHVNMGTWTKESDDTIRIKFKWRAEALRARVDLKKWTMRIEGMGKLPGNEDGPVDFTRS